MNGIKRQPWKDHETHRRARLRAAVTLLLLWLASTLTMNRPAMGDDEEKPRRWLLSGLIGRTSTPALLSTSLGQTIRGAYQTPEFAFGLGVEQDFQTTLAFNLRAYYLYRDIAYSDLDGLTTVTREIKGTFVHVPLQVHFIPKRWFFMGVGAYADYCSTGGLPFDFGWSFSTGVDIRLSKKFGLQLSGDYNMSLVTYDNISPREVFLILGFRYGPNTKPNFD